MHACDLSRDSWASTHILSFSMVVFAGNEITGGWLCFWGSATAINETKRTYNHASVLPVTGRVKTGHWRGPGPEFSAWRQRLSITHVNRSISACSPQAKRQQDKQDQDGYQRHDSYEPRATIPLFWISAWRCSSRFDFTWKRSGRNSHYCLTYGSAYSKKATQEKDL